MGSSKGSAYALTTALMIIAFSIFQAQHVNAVRKSYVVYMGGHEHGNDGISLAREEAITNSHYDLLGSVIGSKEKAKDAIFYSYTKYINGFAANLEEEEAIELSKYPGVLSVFENKGKKLHTTHSWEFLQLERNGMIPKKSIWHKARFGEDVIIGNLDTGVWPEAESFNDQGMGPIPSRWKGTCQKPTMGAAGVQCNKKLIGARYFNKGFDHSFGNLNASCYSPRDVEGHGTHTLSTAGGSPVPSASVSGYGNGTARGGSPAARVAMYRVCFQSILRTQCFDADILAGFEAAIADGVDILSVSFGGEANDYTKDSVSIGSFHAVRNGIVVVCSAGNGGPEEGTVQNVAPWILTVAASTMDRQFPSYVVFNNGTKIMGQSLSTTSLRQEPYPLVFAGNAHLPDVPRSDSELCLEGSLDPKKVEGKIVVCRRGQGGRVEKGKAVQSAGGVGMVIVNFALDDDVLADAHVLPATHISSLDGTTLFDYLNTAKNPVGYITKPTTKIGAIPAPIMAAFSSSGPNPRNPEILKPDITAPGVSVIAAYTGAGKPSSNDGRRIFRSASGTSMSCPHVAGIVGLVKTLHPDWSPAAIKSAIMTTAKIKDNQGHPTLNDKATPMKYGSGHVFPNKAMAPGLVYDITNEDYLDFLCSIGYNSTQVQVFSKTPYKCPSKPLSPLDLNYPSITVPNLVGHATVRRKLKNVRDGTPAATYRVMVVPPKGVEVKVVPTTLTFEKKGEVKGFEVTMQVDGNKMVHKEYVFGSIVWTDGLHHVSSPLVVRSTL